ncbi:MAG: hypothetical protein ACI8P3_004512 [Saprospiraceae bacterium]|jgi:hypothetical protein
MKNLSKILCLLFALLLSTSVFSQSTIGVRGGINLATYDENPFASIHPAMDKKNIIGTDIAVFVKFHVANSFSIQPEFHWMQKGVKSTMTNEPDNLDIEYILRYNYLELPLLARVDYGDKKIALNFYVGPSFGYALDGKYIGKFSDQEEISGHVIVNEDFEEDIEWDTEYGDDGAKHNRFDISIVGGMGLTFETNVGYFVLDARYNYDFNAFWNFEEKAYNPSDKFYNQGLSITAGFAIPIGL